MIIPVFFTFNNSFVIPASAAIYSLLNNADKQHDYILYIYNSDITPHNRKKLQKTVRTFANVQMVFVEIHIELQTLWDTLHFKNHYTVDIFYKLFVSSVFTEYTKIVISDVDVIFCGDISKSFIDFDTSCDFLFAGVRAVTAMYDFIDEHYTAGFSVEEVNSIKAGIGAGYLISNLDLIRKLHMEDSFLEAIRNNAHRLFQPEQDIINLDCAGRLKYLSLNHLVTNLVCREYSNRLNLVKETNFSAEEIADAIEHPIQRHFEGKPKPWEDESVPNFALWYGYLKKTPYYVNYQVVRCKRVFKHILKSTSNTAKKCLFAVISKEKLKKLLGR